jgi:hypothetical protein
MKGDLTIVSGFLPRWIPFDALGFGVRYRDPNIDNGTGRSKTKILVINLLLDSGLFQDPASLEELDWPFPMQVRANRNDPERENFNLWAARPFKGERR